jgi:hypothetical protein
VPRILDVGDGGDDVIADTKNEISSNISAVDVTIEWDMDSWLSAKAPGSDWRGLRNAGAGAIVDEALDIRAISSGGRTQSSRSNRIATSKSSLS